MPQSPCKLNLILIRHAESTDNVHRIWAGWKDAPLSNHGMNTESKQARALGSSLGTTRFQAILSSDLQRAKSTAQAVLSSQPQPNICTLTTSGLLREQNFGSFEGRSYSERVNKGGFQQYGGESKADIAARAQRVVQELILPILLASTSGLAPSIRAAGAPSQAGRQVNVAIVSHGMFLRQIVKVILALDDTATSSLALESGWGLSNTGWCRLSISSLNRSSPASPLSVRVHMEEWNHRDHLRSVVRQKGGIGNIAHDHAQKDIRSFFGQGSSKPSRAHGTAR